MTDPKTWWIVGASEGLGRALAELLDQDGARLILSARSEDRLTELAAGLRDARPLVMDVGDRDSVISASDAARDADGLIYCVGLYDPMTALEWDSDKAIAIAEANFIGAMRVLGHSMPNLLAHGAGRIVLVGSLAGHRGLPGAIGYGASKAALMHLAENLRIDLRDTNLQVQVVNPGFIKTRLTEKNDFKMPQIMSPEQAASQVHAAIRSGRFSTSFPAPFSWLFVLGRYMPLRLFQRLF